MATRADRDLLVPKSGGVVLATIQIGIFCLLFPLSAGAETVRLEYAAEPSCPTALEFRAAVESRARRDVTWSDTDYQVSLIVRLRVERDQSVGVLQSSDVGGVRPLRKVDGANCQVVADALALIAALTIYPATSPREDKDGTPEARVAPEPGSSAPPSSDDIGEPELRSTWRTRLGVGASVLLGLTPKALIAAALPVAFEAPEFGVWSPEFGLTAMSAQTGILGPGSDVGTFRWLAFRLDGCPLRARLLPQVVVTPCVAFEFGTMRAEGSRVGRPVKSSRLWSALGTSTHLYWSPSSVFFQGSMNLSVPLFPTSYMLESTFEQTRTELYETNDVTLAFLISAGLRFREL